MADMLTCVNAVVEWSGGLQVGEESVSSGEWGTEPAMSDLEAMMWRAEADPRLRSTGIFVDRLDHAPDWDRLVAAHEWAVRIVPRLRQRVVESPLPLLSPTWELDPGFDLAYHLRRVRVPEPGTFDQMIALAEVSAMTPLDRARPLWEATLVEGLADGSAGYLLKMHHCLTDGQAGVQLFDLLHSSTPDPTPDKTKPHVTSRRAPDSLARGLSGVIGTARGGTRTAANLGLGLARRPERTISSALRFAGSLARVLGPPPATASPLMQERGLSRRFGTIDIPLARLRAAGKAGGGSLNDAYLAALTGGLRRYHELHGLTPDVLPIAFPVSLRSDDDPLGGNRFAGARIAGPIGIEDPAQRMRAIRERVLEAREEPALDFMGILAPALARIPTGLLTRLTESVTRTVDLQASNIPGLARPAYIAGARIERIYPFGPVPGSAVMAVLMSHDGMCCVAINADATAIADIEVFVECLRAGFDEVLGLGVEADSGDVVVASAAGDAGIAR
jgi:diacylglycerol O-acyltransferase